MKNKEPYPITEEVLNYPGQVVALSIDFHRILGHGRTPKEAAEMADESGEARYVFYRVSANPGVVVA